MRPLFDEGVSLARRPGEVFGADDGRPALATALTDRSMFLVAAKRYGEAYDDFRQATALLD
ncbi:hypothetical protein ACIO93_12830 [Streptomyces sp. NPDC087903]|uniref:hypothetical protein n=1 Tax=Streptomyces sp. NPDC087903 TaxID=3365819 RepID=UPI00382D2117